MSTFRHRPAVSDDLAAISELMDLAIAENMKAFLTPEEIEVARRSMGLDRLLVDDGTYFIIEAPDITETPNPASDASVRWIMVGCGGWGRRKTLYGGDHTPGRDDSFANPLKDAARIRAMYTHPGWVRKGIGSLLLELGEDAARAAGFSRIELGATLAGVPLYQARGYREVSRTMTDSPDSSVVEGDDRPEVADTIILMEKSLLNGVC